jgi:3D (Asp-Asp-Asp) domain-containing protein
MHAVDFVRRHREHTDLRSDNLSATVRLGAVAFSKAGSAEKAEGMSSKTLKRTSVSLRCTLAFWCAVSGVVSLITGACAGRIHPQQRAPEGPPGKALAFTVTAYCAGRVTATGTTPGNGTIAADPAFLPMGSRIRLAGLDQPYNGVYTVTDTGSRVRGRRIDLYIRDCHEAVRFGRRSAQVSILAR